VTVLQINRTPLLLLILTISAFGQQSIQPSVVRLGAAVGSTAPVAGSAWVLGSTAYQDYELSVVYSSAQTGWLSVTPDKGITPTKLTISADPSNLPAGTYTAQINASVGQLHLSAVGTVSFTVAPMGSNPGGLATNPSTLTFSSKALTDPQTITVSNAPGATGAIAFSSFASSTGWLIITQTGSSTPGSVQVQVDVNGLSPGPHIGSVTVTAASNNKSTVVPVTVVVPDAPIGQNITLVPSQKNLTFNAQTGAGATPPQTVVLSTASTASTFCTATSSATWLNVASNSFDPPTPSATCFAPGLFYVYTDANGLPAGTYKGTITLSASGVASVDVPVTFNVSTTPVLNSNPSFISLDTTSGVLSSNLSVTASASLFFTTTISANTGWLSVSSVGGAASPNAVDIAVVANPTGLAPGAYDGSITLAGPSGRPTLVVPVHLTVGSASTANSTLQLSPKTLDFTAVGGDSVVPQYLGISSSLGGSDKFTVSAVADGGWLLVEPVPNLGATWAKVTVNTSIPAGLYTGTIVVNSLVTGNQQTATVNYKLTGRVLTVAPTLLTFTQSAKGAPIPPQELQVTANRASTFRIVSQPAWIKIDAPAGLTTPAKLVVTADPTGMAPGPYEGSIQLSGPSDVLVQVSLTIPSPPTPTVAPPALSFAYNLGTPPPADQLIRVASPSGVLAFTASTTTQSGVNWLTATPNSGSTPGTIVVTINVAKLTPGQHTGAVTINIQDTVVKTVSVPVTLTVTGSAIQVNQVLHSATFTPTLVSPGLIVTLTGLGLGPATAVIGKPTQAGAYDSTLGGVRVLFDGVAAPLLMVQEAQINAIVPYAVSGRATTQVQVVFNSGYSIPIEVKIADTAPGIFTAGSTGKGQAAALNADSTPNSVLNPASAGTVVVLYLTGEGQTDPSGQDGRVISTDLRKPMLPVTASIGGQAAEVLYAGSGPTLVSGLCQVNLRIPDTVNSGSQQVEIQIGGLPTQRGVTVEIR
jgi:uncharacterized protein (TIGR03437 family)